MIVALSQLNSTVGDLNGNANLINEAILCDVAVERQVQISGPDASKFVQMISPRDLSSMKVRQCKYVILTNQKGGILNDPVLLKLDEDRYWFSLADSDVLFWAQGLAHHSGFDVDIFAKNCLLNGLDDIGWTLQFEEKIKDFEKKVVTKKPWVSLDW